MEKVKIVHENMNAPKHLAKTIWPVIRINLFYYGLYLIHLYWPMMMSRHILCISIDI